MLLHLSLVCGGIVFVWFGLEDRGGPGGKEEASKLYQVRAVKMAPSSNPELEVPTEDARHTKEPKPEASRTQAPSQAQPPEFVPASDEPTEQQGIEGEVASPVPVSSKAQRFSPAYPVAGPSGPSRTSPSNQKSRQASAPRRVTDKPAPLWSQELEGERDGQADFEPDLQADRESGVPSSSGPAAAAGPTVPSRPLFLPSVSLPDSYQDLRSASLQVEFLIEADGRFQVHILKGTGVEELDRQIEKVLQQARWSPRKIAGVPVGDRRVVDLDIER